MQVKVNGYNYVKSKKDGTNYTIVHVTSDIPFNNGDGTQNIEIFLKGSKPLEIDSIYTAITETVLQNGQLVSRIVDLKPM